MPLVRLTPHLYRFFPALEHRELEVPAGAVGDALRAVDQIAPGFSDYVIDERGALRRHVHLSIDGVLVIDRKGLSDRVEAGSTVHVFQALSGG